MLFGVDQTARLDLANDRNVTSLQVIRNCEIRDREAIAASEKRWWQVWR